MIAGTDTTSVTFQMMVYYLGKHPEIAHKVRKMINKVIKTDEDITYDNLKQLHYIEWIMYEAIRMNGPINNLVARKAVVDHNLLDIPVTNGTGLIVGTVPNQYNPDLFEDPEVFRPERWDPEAEKTMTPYSMIGFSGGPRNCIGKQLALL